MEKLLSYIRKQNDKKVFLFFGVSLSIFVILPVLQVIIRSFNSDNVYFNALKNSGLLQEGIINTIELVLKVGFFSAFIGFGLAYLITFYEVKFRKTINVLLVLPLCIPVYVAAYTYTNIYYNFPVLETIFRTSLFMDGVVFIYVLFLYPYVYIATKSYLNKNLTEYMEVSETLSGGKIRTLVKVILPITRPIIIGSVLFVIFETLSDFAVVEYYGELTLSRYINIAWFNQGDINTASKLAIYILFIMFVIVFIERWQRKNKRYSNPENVLRKHKKYQPKLLEKIMLYGSFGVVITLSCILPISQMLKSAYINRSYIPRLDMLELITNTLLVTFLAIVVIIVCALILTLIANNLKGTKKGMLSSVLVMGYSIPSMVLALGIYLLFIQFDKGIFELLQSTGYRKMLVTSSIFIVVIGFFFKFFSIAYSNLISAYGKIDKNLYEVSETLGENKLSTFFRVNLPLLRKPLIGITIILFIDMVKELTLVYSLRPFNFKTLSTEVYRYAGNEMVEVASFPSLVIIALSAILIIYLEVGREYVKTRKH